MKKINVDVSWMHCKSCELLLEKSLKKAKNIKKVSASEKKWIVELCCEWWNPDMSEIETIIKEAWYNIWKWQKLTWLNKEPKVYKDIFYILLTFFAIYFIFSAFWINFAELSNFSKPTIWVALLVWLTAWVSSCMALVGWLILWVSAKWSEDHSNLSRFSRFEPHLYFNTWRIVGFWILGWILGVFGKIFSLSPFAIWVMTIATGVIMLLLGINLSEISPKISSFSLTLPKFLWKNVWNQNSSSKHIFALSTWALTFFLPCWFTLAMQAYAITTWSFIDWALIMAAFALGTAPWLLWIWWLASYFSWARAKKLFKATWVLVMLLAFFNISNWYTLAQLGSSSVMKWVEANPWEVQEIRMTQSWDWYSPSVLHVKPNTKIRWIITSTNPFSCSSQLVAPSLGIQKNLEKWENVIEFVSGDSGEIKFSCSMWMYNGKIIIDSDWTSASTDTDNTLVSSSDKQFGWWCSVGSWQGQKNTQTSCWGAWNIVSSDTVAKTPVPGDAEKIDATYTSDWMSPQSFELKKWHTYVLTIDVKDDIYWCMSTIYIPWFDENMQELRAWTKVRFTIKADKLGRYPITCAMWVPHWFLNIE